MIEKIRNLGLVRSFERDEFLFNAGDSANGFYQIQSGEVRIFRMDEQGREIEVVRLGPGDFFGEAIVFVSDFYPAFAQSVKKTEVLFFPKDIILGKIDREPKVALFFIKLLAQKCIVLNKRIETLELRTIRQRLAQFLLSQCTGERPCVVELKMKKVELAKYLGTISETLSRTLKQLRDDGLVRVQGRQIHISDIPRLKQEIGV